MVELRVLTKAAILFVLLVMVAGCTSERPGTAVGVDESGTATSEASAEEETYGAPRVSDALDVDRFVKQPCLVLTQAQLTEFRVVKPGVSDTDSEIAKHSGPGCHWEREDVQPSASIIGMSFLVGNKNGLSDTYRGRSRFDFFEETTVDGFPAVFNDLSDGRENGNCNITVGISDTLTFRAREGGGPHGQIVCDRTKQLASAILDTLKAGA
ncbi:DUF3558 domain-containing protein [Actinophytocola sediminis]